MLPSLGQLPSLKSLSIEDFNGLESIGAEFYKSDDDHSSLATLFPSLEDLTFSRMQCWKEWHSSESNAFLHLKKLKIRDCPRLYGDLPNYLPALETLDIECDQVVSSFLRAPTIDKVVISECKRVELQSSSIEGCKQVESMTVSYQTCLRYLRLGHCSSAISFPGGYLPASLKILEIKDWKKLEFPKQNHKLLESLQIVSSCDSLTSFPLEAFPNLKTLDISECENLESLSFPLSQSQHNALYDFHISNCPNFVSFPREGLPAPSMTRFSVKRCNKLKSLPCDVN